jgi:Domain of unknown function (DUF4157)
LRRKRMQEDDEYMIAKERAQKKAALEISQAKDQQEKEADEVAKKVVEGNSKSEIRNSELNASKTGTVHPKTESDTPPMADANFEQQLDSSKGSGQSLDDATKNEMETKMGADFSGVKIHTDSAANAMAEQINAKAFTYGQDIYFKSLKYDPYSKEGKELLAHELWHVVQNVEGKFGYPVARKILRAPEMPSKDPGSKRFVRDSVMKEIREAITDEWWSIDDVAAKLTESEMASLTIAERKKLLDLMLKETFWADEDDQTVIRAIRTTPAADARQMVVFLVTKGDSDTKRYSAIRSGISESFWKEFYIATSSIGYVDANKIPELEKMLAAGDFDVDSYAEMLLEGEIRSLKLSTRIGLIRQMGVKDYYVDEGDSNTIVRLVQYVPAHLIEDPKNPQADKTKSDEQKKFRNFIHPEGSESVYTTLGSRMTDKALKDFYEALDILYPDANKKRIEEITKLEKEGDSDTDSAAAMLTTRDIAEMDDALRKKLLSTLSDDYRIGDEDEKTLIKLVSLFSSDKKKAEKQKAALRTALLENERAVLDRLRSGIDGENYETFLDVVDELMAGDEGRVMNKALEEAVKSDDAKGNTEDLAAYLGPKQIKQLSVEVRFKTMKLIVAGAYTNWEDEETVLRFLESFVVDETKRHRYYELKNLDRELSLSEKIEMENLAETEKTENDRLELLKLFEEDPDAKDDMLWVIEGDNDTKFNRLFATIDIEHRKERLEDADDLWFPSWSRDSAVATLSREDMAGLSKEKRVEYINDIAGGWWFYVVGDEDENSLVLLIDSIPNGKQADYVLKELAKDDGEMYQRLDSVIHGAEYEEFHAAIQNAYLKWQLSLQYNADGTENAKEKEKQADERNAMLDQQLNHPRVYPWSDPGLIEDIYTSDYDYEVAWENGKISVRFTNADDYPEKEKTLDPYTLIGVYYVINDTDLGGREDMIEFMPAINLFRLANKQYKHQLWKYAELGLMLVGVGEVMAGVEILSLVGIAAITNAVASTAIVVLDSYADEIAEWPLGMEFLQLVNGLTILAVVSGGLQFLTRAENLAKIKGSWAKVKNLLKAGTRAEIEAGFIGQLELAEQIAERSRALRTTEELTEFRKWLRQLEDEGKLTAELRGEAEVAAARYVEEVVAVNAKRVKELELDPQTSKPNNKSVSEAESVLSAEKDGIVYGSRRPNLSKGEPNLDFVVEGPPPYKFVDIKSPVEGKFRSIEKQVKDVIAGINGQKAPDVLHVIDLKNLSALEKEKFMQEFEKMIDQNPNYYILNK